MSKPFDFSGSGEDDYCLGSSAYLDLKQRDQILSLGHDVDVLFPLCKRSRICAPFVFSDESFVRKRPSIDVLPDECLFEIFRRLLGGEEKSACACVSKRWLMLISSICADESCAQKTAESSLPEGKSVPSRVLETFVSQSKEKVAVSNGAMSDFEAGKNNSLDDGYLSRCLEGKKATDIRLAAIAVGTGSRGGLGKLSIHGSDHTRGVTDAGLKAIACGCPSLRYLSLWHIPYISDEGLVEIAKGCSLLENLDLCHCPGISDKALLAIANNCPNLRSLTVESCSNIGNEGLVAIASCCPNLKSITIKNCSQVGDQGIDRLFALAGNVLTKVRLESLNITDRSLAAIGCYGSSLTDLVVTGLQHVNEKGFWVMGKCLGLVNLHSFTVTACQGLTDIGLDAVVKGSPYLKRACLRKCAFVSDVGLVSFVKAAKSLESLQVDECRRITEFGFFGILAHCGKTLKTLALANCFGIKDRKFGVQLMTPCNSVRSLSIRNCPGFGNASLSMLATVCPNIVHMELNGLNSISDEGIVPLVESSEAGLVKVKLSGCSNVTDRVVSAVAKLHGGTLEVLDVDGCGYITDASLCAIAEYCSVLRELDVTNSRITDAGIAALANDAVQVTLRILSLADCSLLRDDSLPALVKLGDSLVGLNIQHCRGISPAAVNLLEDRLWTCDILS